MEKITPKHARTAAQNLAKQLATTYRTPGHLTQGLEITHTTGAGYRLEHGEADQTGTRAAFGYERWNARTLYYMIHFAADVLRFYTANYGAILIERARSEGKNEGISQGRADVFREMADMKEAEETDLRARAFAAREAGDHKTADVLNDLANIAHDQGYKLGEMADDSGPQDDGEDGPELDPHDDPAHDALLNNLAMNGEY